MKFLAPSKMKFHPLLKLLVPLIEALPKCGTTLDDRDAYKVRYKNILCLQLIKVWVFWEGHKILKHLRRTFDKRAVFCARNSVLVKKSTKIFQNKCGQVILYKLYLNSDFRKQGKSGFTLLC